jgi:formylglycine-generating enzyme required for sulfatase activity
MKRLFSYFVVILFAVSSFYAQRPVNEWYWVNPQKGTGGSAKKELLTGIDMVTITKNPEKFVIGENTQSFTAKVTVPPFEMNKYETTYQLWYKVLQEAQKRGYEFANPGQ